MRVLYCFCTEYPSILSGTRMNCRTYLAPLWNINSNLMLRLEKWSLGYPYLRVPSKWWQSFLCYTQATSLIYMLFCGLYGQLSAILCTTYTYAYIRNMYNIRKHADDPHWGSIVCQTMWLCRQASLRPPLLNEYTASACSAAQMRIIMYIMD